MHRDEEREVSVVERGPAGRVPRETREADHALLRRRPHQAGGGESSPIDSHFELIPSRIAIFIDQSQTDPFFLQVRVGNSTEPGDNQLCNWIPKEIEEGATEVLDCYEDLVGR